MKLMLTFNKGLMCSLFFASIMLFSLSMDAQTSFTKSGKTTTSKTSKSTTTKTAPNKQEAINLKTTRSLDGRVKSVRLNFAMLSMSENGYIMLDRGEGAEILKNGEDKPFTSIIAGLNYLIGVKKWRLVNSYNLTNESPFPSFLLNKNIPEG